jgi:7-cyano-7-deazaguanine synthase
LRKNHRESGTAVYRIAPVRSRIAVLASGGLDSSVLLAELAKAGREVFPVYVRAGLRWEPSERAVLRGFIRALASPRVRPLTELRMPMDDVAPKHWSVTGRGVPGYEASFSSNYIIGRNFSLIAKAAVFCAYHRIGELAMAPLQANPFPDARPEFFRALAGAIALGLGLRLRIRTPFLGLTKAKLIRRARKLPLQLTLSCARPHGLLHCGRCTKCAERIEAFREAGVPDPTRYARKAR